MALEKVVGAAGGLVALVLTVVTIPGDVMLPLPADFSGPSDQEDATYFGVCPRTASAELIGEENRRVDVGARIVL